MSEDSNQVPSELEKRPTVADAVIERLWQVYGVKNDAQLAKAMDAPKTTIASWRQRGQPAYATVIAIASEKRLNLNWLINGIGDPGISLYRIEEPAPDFVTPVTEGGASGTSSSKNSLTTDTSEYPSNRGQSAASPDFVILRNCIEVLEERDSYHRLSPGDKAKAIVALYELYQIEGKASRDLLDKRQA